MTAEEAARPPIVVRDNRRVDAGGSASKATPDGAAENAAPSEAKRSSAKARKDGAGKPAASEPAPPATPEETVIDAEVVEMTITPDKVEPEASGSAPAASPEKDTSSPEPSAPASDKNKQEEDPKVKTDSEGGHLYAELSALRSNLDELTRDLQRVTAEYANYRKRVDRDRVAVQEQAAGNVLSALLPVLDDLDRARNHGDLVGPFAAVADQLTGALAKFGLTAFGEAGDAFDPQLHEAVSHTSSPDVTETTCVEVMRRGYMLGDRLLRPALVAVADPE